MDVQKQDAAYIAGKRTADNLAGYTTKEQQREVLNDAESIDKGTVKTYFTGYKSSKQAQLVPFSKAALSVGVVNVKDINSPPFFKQVMSEYGFEEKEKVSRDMAGKLRDYLQAQGRTDEAQKIQQILNNRKIYDEDVKDLDAILKKTIDYNY